MVRLRCGQTSIAFICQLTTATYTQPTLRNWHGVRTFEAIDGTGTQVMLGDEQNFEMNEKIVIRPDEVAGHVPKAAESMPRRSLDALIVSIAIVTVLFVVVIGALFFVAPNWSSEKTGLTNGGRRSSRQSSATLAYWNQLREIGDGLDDENAFTETDKAEQYALQLQQQRSAIGRAIDEITRLATLDVDEDASEVGAKMAEFLSEFDALLASLERLVKDSEAFGARSTSADLMVESFVRGFFGDPFGTTNELRAEQGKLSDRHQRILGQAEALQSRANELRIFGSRMRAKLTARYGMEFPPLE